MATMAFLEVKWSFEKYHKTNTYHLHPIFFLHTEKKNYSKKQDGDPLVITVKLKIVLTTSGHFVRVYDYTM